MIMMKPLPPPSRQTTSERFCPGRGRFNFNITRSRGWAAIEYYHIDKLQQEDRCLISLPKPSRRLPSPFVRALAARQVYPNAWFNRTVFENASRRTVFRSCLLALMVRRVRHQALDVNVPECKFIRALRPSTEHDRSQATVPRL